MMLHLYWCFASSFKNEAHLSSTRGKANSTLSRFIEASAFLKYAIVAEYFAEGRDSWSRKYFDESLSILFFRKFFSSFSFQWLSGHEKSKLCDCSLDSNFVCFVSISKLYATCSCVYDPVLSLRINLGKFLANSANGCIREKLYIYSLRSFILKKNLS